MLLNIFKKKKPEVKRNPDETDFCYYPFFQVLLAADGKYMPCSHHAAFISENGKEISVNTHNIEQAWNSPYMQQLRSDFKNNIRNKGCSHCWKEQSLGLKPMRYDSYGYNIPESQVENPASPMRVEINASNVCNLRCRICWSHASSRWIKEVKELYNEDAELHFNMTPENQAIIRQWVPHFTQIGFFGGEPLMSEENIELMRYCVSTGHSKHISLLINTNATVYTDELVNLFKQFQNVYLNFSIDDIGKRFEYQRSGAKWNEVVENMKQYIKHGGFTGSDQLQIKICCSVTSMNIYYFPEYFEFMNEHFPGLPVFWNLVFQPWQLSIQLLPAEVKEQIAQRLKNFVNTTYKMDTLRTRTIEDLISYLKGQDERSFSEFFTYIERHDKYRQESFLETFPEFYSVIKSYKEKPLSV
ncbi:MAG: twitch domain-containing radical SAM protein [Chitinophagales bacterium]|nr:twitch domain-containing radical SAM protein [Chitinophagales bacterium]